MIIFIVIKNDKVDEVFFTRETAEFHVEQLTKHWNICSIVEREVKDI